MALETGCLVVVLTTAVSFWVIGRPLTCCESTEKKTMIAALVDPLRVMVTGDLLESNNVSDVLIGIAHSHWKLTSFLPISDFPNVVLL